jgi:hypothetical protein
MLRRRSLLALPFAILPRLRAADRLNCFGLSWSVPLGSDWQVARVDGVEVLRLATARPAQKEPRRPFQYALLEAPPFRKFTLDCEVRRQPPGQPCSLILVYAWRDYGHFNYAHLSNDSASEQPVHNGIFHVYGGDRVRISPEQGPGTLPSDAWHAVRLAWDSATGLAEVHVNAKTSPALRAVDLSLGPGRIALGSFFHTGAFRNVKIAGDPA